MKQIQSVILFVIMAGCLLNSTKSQKPTTGPAPKTEAKAKPATSVPVVKPIEQHNNGEKRSITILYEALCPESERFMEQLGPVYEALKDYMQVEFVPYGLTKLACKRFINDKCERPIFTCKHGPSGCKANRLHDCALQYSESPEKQMNFIMCSMGPNRVSAEKCLHLLAFKENEIDNCMIFDEGTELQLKSYQRTEPFKPKQLPMVIFDDNYSEEIQEGAVKDFRVLACNLMAHKYQMISEETAPSICKTGDVFPSLA